MKGLASWLCVVMGWVAALPLGAPSSGQDALRRFEFRQPHMGTEFSIILYTRDESVAKRASDAAFARVAELNGILSDYDPDSEAMRLCARAGGDWIPVSADLYQVLDRSLHIAQRTQGAFDPTINPVVRLWRRARRTRQLPDPKSLADARALVGYQFVELDPAKQSARLTKPGMKLDFGGIAKGYAADEALAVIKQHGIHRALVAAAGDIACGDAPPNERGWKVQVAALKSVNPSQPPAPVLLLANRAVSTSGDAEQFVEIDGVRYSHIVDPRTGLGLQGRASVTVVADRGADADSLATAVAVLGSEKGIALVDATKGTAALVVSADAGAVTVAQSARWRELPKATP